MRYNYEEDVKSLSALPYEGLRICGKNHLHLVVEQCNVSNYRFHQVFERKLPPRQELKQKSILNTVETLEEETWNLHCFLF